MFLKYFVLICLLCGVVSVLSHLPFGHLDFDNDDRVEHDAGHELQEGADQKEREDYPCPDLIIFESSNKYAGH